MNAVSPGPVLPLTADAGQIGDFADALFRYADPGTFASLRAFYDDVSSKFSIAPHKLADDPAALAHAAVPWATRAARCARPVVFCPPIATFTNADKADEASLANGLALSVECDQAAAAARAKLEWLLGPATVVVASGGEWTDPETGELQDKLHLHWRLSEPTRSADDHRLLKLARTLATGLVGGDASNKPVVHPLRWPGSWHCKGAPRLVRIVSLTKHEIGLSDALERLQEAADAVKASGCPQPSPTPGTPSDAGSGEARRMADLVREVLTGRDYHAPLVSLAMRYLKAGMADGQAVETLRGVMQAVPEPARDDKEGTVQAGRWQARYDDIPRAVSTARGKLGASPAAAEPDTLAGLVNPADLQGVEPPDREWIVDGWLPVGTVTSLYGGAGYGKTLLAQQLQTATAQGMPFLGLPTAQCRSLAFYCEDDQDELHRRQRNICAHYGARMHELGAMRWQGRSGKANIMATVEKGLLQLSEFHEFVCRAVRETGARLVILDNIAQLFGGNENARPEVTQFVNSLSAIAIENNAAVLLLGHPGKATDSAYSGSTAWDAAVRSRWWLDRPAAETGDEGPALAELADLRVLRKAKANYSGTGDEVALRWVEGAFQVEGAGAVRQVMDLATRAAASDADERGFLDALDQLTEQGRHVSASKNAPNFAPKMMVGKPAAAGVSFKRLGRAMERLFSAGRIEVGPFGRDKYRRPVSGIVRKKVSDLAAGHDDLAAGCSEVAADLAAGPSDLAAECSKAQAECSKATANPLISLQQGVCSKDAAECSKATANPLISLQQSRSPMPPIYTTYISSAPLGAALEGQAQGGAGQ